MKLDLLVINSALVLVLAPASMWGQAAALDGDECPTEPIINVVHGDGHGADVAEEFRTGCDINTILASGSIIPKCRETRLHAPGELRGKHLHISEPPSFDFQRFFWDENFTLEGVTGQDADPTQGLESAAILFYAGHSKDFSPTAFKKISVDVNRISLGDKCTRYFWMVSCRVLAHGPRRPVKNFKVDDFIAPHEFDPSIETDSEHQSVFKRWGKIVSETGKSPLNSQIRMVCGGSSRIGGRPHPTEYIWRHLLIDHLGPAEAFLLGLTDSQRGGIPLCMSRGGENPWQSPLGDVEFVVAAPNLDEQDYIWIEFPVSNNEILKKLQDNSPSWWTSYAKEAFTLLPAFMPVLTGPSDLESPGVLDLNNVGVEVSKGAFGFESRTLGDEGQEAILGLIDPADVCVEHQEANGAVVLAWRPLETPSFDIEQVEPADILNALADSMVSEAPNISIALRKEAERLGRTITDVIDFYLRGVPAKSVEENKKLEESEISQERGCRFYIFHPSAKTAVGEVAIIGAATEGVVGICPPARSNGHRHEGKQIGPCLRKVPALLTISFPFLATKPSEGVGGPQSIFLPDEARAMIEPLFPSGLSLSDYEEVRYRLGYKVAPPHCRQSRLYLVYEFDLQPRPRPLELTELGPLTIEVPAHRLCETSNPAQCFDAIEESWKCSPEATDADN